MSEIIRVIAQHGYLLLFLWVLAEQIGLPFPAMPALLAAGVLTALGKMSLSTSAGLALMACLIGDTIWFALGRRFGGRVLTFLCRMSLMPDTCVRKTRSIFEKHGPASLLLAKFMPGFDAVVVPMAGSSGMSIGRFAFYDIGGCGLYVLSFISIGYLLANSITTLDRFRASIGIFGFWGVVIVAAGLIARRIYVRQKFRRDVRMARIAPQELLQLMQTDKRPFVVDLRHPLDFLPFPQLIPTAIRLNPNELLQKANEIPHDRDIILYCTCPSEASSASLALKLKRLGIDRVRPLEGGFFGWRDKGYPLEEFYTPDEHNLFAKRKRSPPVGA